jgi:hypothetical protein
MKLLRIAALLPILAAAPAGCGGSKTHTSTAASTPGTPAPATRRPSPSAPASASREVSPGIVRASVGGVSATLHASGHHPRVGRPWPVSFDVSRSGAPARARVRYEYLFAGQVVAHRSNYGFTGSFHDIFLWPSSAVGYPLTFRALITTGALKLSLDYPVEVVR